jgi:hypothetical protein
MIKKLSLSSSVLLVLLLLISTLFPSCVRLEPTALRPMPGQVLTQIKAVQILILPGSEMEDFRPQLRQYRAAGFDTAILRAFHLPGDRPHGPAADSIGNIFSGVYFPTETVPLIKDLITPFVLLCREEGIRPFAWMVTRDARFDNLRLTRDGVYDPEKGGIRPGDALDILDLNNHRYLEKLFMDLAATGVDGILLQDDLALRMTEGFTESALKQYRMETGDRVPPYSRLKMVEKEGKRYVTADQSFSKWTQWKAVNLVTLARKLEEAVWSVNRDIVLIVNQMYETLTDPENGRLWLSQDFDLSMKKGPSYTAVMLYHRQMQQELGLGLAETIELMDLTLSGRRLSVEPGTRIVLKFQTRDWTTGDSVPGDELASVLMTASRGGWSIALVPPPTEEQLQAITPILEGM